MQKNNRLYNPAQVAKKLGVSRWTIYQWIREGKLPAKKLGRGWRISGTDLHEFWEGPPPDHTDALTELLVGVINIYAADHEDCTSAHIRQALDTIVLNNQPSD